jgi:hypothetical protein
MSRSDITEIITHSNNNFIATFEFLNCLNISELENVKREIQDTKVDLKRARDAGQDIVPFIVYLAELQKKSTLSLGNPHFTSPSIHQRILSPILNAK